MPKFWTWLRECWGIPGADARTQRLLLNRQLSSFFRLAVAYFPANILASISLVVVFWPGPGVVASMAWLAVFGFVHVGRDTHAFIRLRYSRLDEAFLSSKDLHGACLWCLLTASTWGAGLVVFSRYTNSPGSLFLIPGLVLGLMSLGALSAISVPALAIIWLGIFTITAVFVVLCLGLDHQTAALTLLAIFSTLLVASTLSLSRLFVLRTKAEFTAEHESQVVRMLLGDFEEGASDWLWESDPEGALTRASGRLARALALNEEQVDGRKLWTLFSNESLTSLASDRVVGAMALRQCLLGVSAFADVVVEACVNGVTRSWSINGKRLHSSRGEHIGWRGVGSEVTDARARERESAERERRLVKLAMHDSLTTLPNRRAFFQHLKQIEQASLKGFSPYAAILIDLDNFKAVNDALGHSIGDAVLRSVADRLQQCLYPGDFLARLGGDEFAVLVSGEGVSVECNDIEERFQLFLKRLRPPEEVEHYQVDVRGSIGAAMATSQGMTPDELMRRADIALYAAKGAGRDTGRIYQEGMGESLRKRLSLVSDLSHAISRDELRLKYQCIVDSTSGRIVACEALLRWEHPKYGLLSPDDFVPIAEESGLIVPVGMWVLEQACRAAREWPSNVLIAVNVSAKQLNNRSMVSAIKSCIHSTGLPLDRLELEITESSLAQDAGTAREVLVQLRDAGIQLAIDDFGTGYSSMSQLRDWPFSKLKIDRSFVKCLDGNSGDASQAIVASVLHLSQLMSLSVVAEGVENGEQQDILRALGCRFMQGYYFSKPVSADVMFDIICLRNGLES